MKKAFTLIEVMVVLSILAIIAILAYNFFGNTMKDATETSIEVEVYNNLRQVADAMELMAIKEPVRVEMNGSRQNDLVSGGYLKALPQPGPQVCPTGCSWYCYYGYDDVDGHGDKEDGVVEIYPVTEQVCDLINAKYSSLTQEWEYDQSAGEPHKYPETETVYCLDWGGDDFSIMHVFAWDVK